MRMHSWLNLGHYPKVLKVWGASWDVKSATQRKKALQAWLKATKVISGYKLSDDDIHNVFKTLKSYRPEELVSYPSILFILAEKFKEFGYVYHPKAIKTGGEKLYQYQRELVEEVFGCKVFNHYGSRDIPGIAQECDVHDGLHMNMENHIMEVRNKDGKISPTGEGELIVTHLHNYASPFIRYCIGDLVKISGRQCTCGRNLQLIDEVIGRTFDLLEFPNGNRVGGSFWTLVMRSVEGIQDFRVMQHSNQKIEIQYTKSDTRNNLDFTTLKARIHEYSGPQLEILFSEKEELELTKSGKIQFVLKKK